MCFWLTIVYHNGVHIEFNQVLQSEACRLQQLQCHTSAHNHPLNRFFWGKLDYVNPYVGQLAFQLILFAKAI